MIQQFFSILSSSLSIHPNLLLFLATFTTLNILSNIFSLKKKKDSLMLAPYKYPFIGSTLDYYKNPHLLIQNFTKKFGPRFRMHFHGEIVTVVGADEATEVFNHQELNFMKSQNKYFDLALLHGYDANKYIRDIGTQALMKTLIPNISEYGVGAYEEFLHDVNLTIQDREFVIDDLGTFLRKFVSRTSAFMVVGDDLCRNDKMFDMFENSITEIGKDFMPGPFRVLFPTLNKLYLRHFYKKSGAIEKYRNITEILLRANTETLKNRCNTHPKTCSVISYIMNTYFNEIDNNAIHTLTTMIIVFIFVAAHTTSEAITYVAYCLVKYPEYIQELREEQELLLTGFDQSKTGDHLIPTPVICRRMVKLDSFIHEALRIRKGGIGLAHTNIARHDVVLRSGTIIEPDKEVLINLWHVNFDENNQAPLQNLEAFDGFRFVNNDINSTKSGKENIIFGLGRHACPGRWFAIYQIKSILSYFIRQYDMKAISEITMIHSDNEHVSLPQGSVRFTKRKV